MFENNLHPYLLVESIDVDILSYFREYVRMWRSRGIHVIAWTPNHRIEKDFIRKTLNTSYITDTLLWFSFTSFIINFHFRSKHIFSGTNVMFVSCVAFFFNSALKIMHWNCQILIYAWAPALMLFIAPSYILEFNRLNYSDDFDTKNCKIYSSQAN